MGEASTFTFILCMLTLGGVVLHRLCFLIVGHTAEGHFVRWDRYGAEASPVRSAVYQFRADDGEDYEACGLATSYKSDLLERPVPATGKYHSSNPKSAIPLIPSRVLMLPISGSETEVDR